MANPVSIQDESAAHQTQVFEVVAAAFERDNEAQLVDMIRSRDQALLSLVAITEDKVVGHVLVSPIAIDGNQSGYYAGIAPLSVAPSSQGKQVGSALMNDAIARSKKLGIDALFLLGNPRYYERFGFTRSHIGNDYGATDAFMHLELVDGILSDLEGTARYVRAFNEIGA